MKCTENAAVLLSNMAERWFCMHFAFEEETEMLEHNMEIDKKEFVASMRYHEDFEMFLSFFPERAAS